MVYVAGGPVQPAAEGVTVMVAVTGVVPVFTAEKPGVFPLPEAASPMPAFEFVQEKVAPATVLVNAEAATLPPLQTVMLAGTVTEGIGCTVIVYEEGVPGQPDTVGVTVIVAVMLDVPPFVAVKAGVLPDPLAARPIAGLELVQVKVPPAGKLLNELAATVDPAQTVMFAGTVTVGVGFTVIVYDTGVPVQPAAEGVTVTVDVIAEDPVLTAVNPGVLPEPLAARPMAVFEFVHVKVAPATLLVKEEAATEAPLHTVMLGGTVTFGIERTVMV